MTAIPSPLVFTYQDCELQRFRREAARSRGSAAYALWLIALPMIVVIGVAVLAAQKAELIEPREVPSVLIAAYLAYAFGVGLVMLVGRLQQRQIERQAMKGQAESERRIAVSDTGIVATSANYDLRVTWHVAKSITVRPDVVLIWLEWYQFIAVPMRAFAAADARVAFITAVREWIKSARDQRPPRSR
jgi:hypothetical protein